MSQHSHKAFVFAKLVWCREFAENFIDSTMLLEGGQRGGKWKVDQYVNNCTCDDVLRADRILF